MTSVLHYLLSIDIVEFENFVPFKIDNKFPYSPYTEDPNLKDSESRQAADTDASASNFSLCVCGSCWI
jgi:hypothetical protein